MSGQNPSSGKVPGKTSGHPGGKPRTLLCEEWEALLVDALDGTLAPNESSAFESHRESCLACAQLLEEAKRGSEWLHFLETEPEVPADLVGRILAKTTGPTATVPMEMPAIGSFPGMGGAAIAMPSQITWSGNWLPRMQQHATQSRLMMTAAMAFFSIAFILNQTGVKLNSFHLADLKPTTLASSLTRQFYVADAHVMRYYDNLRFVYELESRVKEMRRETESTPAPAPGKDSPGKKPVTKKTDGSAQRHTPAPAAPLPAMEYTPGPILASWEKRVPVSGADGTNQIAVRHRTRSELPKLESGPSAVKNVRTERSLA